MKTPKKGSSLYTKEVFYSCFTGLVLGAFTARFLFNAGFEATTAILVVVLLWGVYVASRMAYTNDERLDRLEELCRKRFPEEGTNAESDKSPK